MNNIDKQWRELIAGENHILLAKSLSKFFIKAVKIAVDSSALANTDAIQKIIKNKKIDDLSDVTWLCTDLKFKLIHPAYGRTYFVYLDKLIVTLNKLGLIDNTDNAEKLVETSMQIGATAKGLKYIRNVDAHCKYPITDFTFVLFVCSTIFFLCKALSLQSSKEGKVLLAATKNLLKELTLQEFDFTSPANGEDHQEQKSLTGNEPSLPTGAPPPDDAENVEDESQSPDPEEELKLLTPKEAESELLEFAQFIRKIFLEKGATVQKQDNILKPAIIDLILDNKISSVELLRKNSIFDDFLSASALADEQLSIFSDELESILQRIDFIDE